VKFKAETIPVLGGVAIRGRDGQEAAAEVTSKIKEILVTVASGERRDISRERQLELELNRAKQLIGDQALVIEILKKSR
jgi:hypothetical protein